MSKQNTTGLRVKVQNKIRSHALLSLSAIGLMITIGLYSCKKEVANNVKEKDKDKFGTISKNTDDDSITNEIKDFYEVVKSVNRGNASSNVYTVGNSIFLIEGAYNYLATVVSDDKEEVPFGFNITSAEAATGEVSAAEASRIFNEIRDQLVSIESSIDHDTKQLSHFDLEVEESGGEVVYTIRGSFSTGLHIGTVYNPEYQFTDCTDTVQGPSNKAFLTYSGWSDWPVSTPYSKGQAYINLTTKATYNVSTTKMGAAQMLRLLALKTYNQRGCQGMLPGYWVLISTYLDNTYAIINTPISQYKSLGISGELSNNYKKYYAETYFSNNMTGVDAIYNDTDKSFKKYLTRPMMNFYLRNIYDYFSYAEANAGTPNAWVYDFNIKSLGDPLDNYPPSFGMGPYWRSHLYSYIIKTGKFIMGCPAPMALGSL